MMSADITIRLLWILGIWSIVRQISPAAPRQKPFVDTRHAAVHYVRASASAKHTQSVPDPSAPLTLRGTDKSEVLYSVDQVAMAFPPQCTTHELAIIKYQLPDFRCRKTASRPWGHHCSFSYATRCPHQVWFREQYTDWSQASIVGDNVRSDASSTPIIVMIGCGSGLQAVNTMRMVSGNPQFGIQPWEAAVSDTIVDSDSCPIQPTDLTPRRFDQDEIQVHCTESNPEKFQELQTRAERLGWQDHLIAYNVDITDHDGLLVSDDGSRIPSYGLDAFVTNHLQVPSTRIDYLHLGGEEMSYDIINGGAVTLQKHVKYLEFEYNWKGSWREHTLSEAVGVLRTHDFVCYWAGSFGNIWRLTDCWHNHYDYKFWSNVACVNLRLAEPLATKMEAMAVLTIQRQHSIHFMDVKLLNTDGSRFTSKSGDGAQ